MSRKPVPDPIEKECSQCKTVKPIDQFRLQKRRTGTYRRHSFCTECHKAHHRKWLREHGQKRDPYRDKLRHIKISYGLSSDEYEELVKSHEGKCRICGNLFTERGPSVDHNHENGQVRGLLCIRCNTALGFLENTEWRQAAESYLREYELLEAA